MFSPRPLRSLESESTTYIAEVENNVVESAVLQTKSVEGKAEDIVIYELPCPQRQQKMEQQRQRRKEINRYLLQAMAETGNLSAPCSVIDG